MSAEKEIQHLLLVTKIRHAYMKKKCLQHQQFPGGLPSQYYAGPTLLNFSVQMGTGAFNVVWPQSSK